MKPLIMLADSHTPFLPGQLDRILGTPTLHHRATQEQLEEALGDSPRWEPTNADLCRMAAEWDERTSESRRKPFKLNPHDD